MTAVAVSAPFGEPEEEPVPPLVDCPVRFDETDVGYFVEAACGFQDEADTLSEAQELWAYHDCDGAWIS